MDLNALQLISLKNQVDQNAASLGEKANQSTVSALQTSVNNIGNASPKGIYATLTALQAAFPTGTTGIYITTDNGHWYYWNGSAWTDGGQYQGNGIENGSIDQLKLNAPYIPMPVKLNAITGTGFLDISGDGEFAVVSSTDGIDVYKDNIYVGIDVPETTINGITYSVTGGIMTLNGVSSPTQYTTISNFIKTLTTKLLDKSYHVKLFVIEGTLPTGVTIKPALNAGYNLTLNNTTIETHINNLAALDVSGNPQVVIATNVTLTNVKIALILKPVVTSITSYVNGTSIDPSKTVKCDATMWAFSTGVINKYLYYTPNFNVLSGRKIYADGDSICEGAGSGQVSYADIIASSNEMILTKVAVGGTTFAIRNGRTDSICERVKLMSGTYDYILIEGGYNDIFSSTTIGTLTAGYTNTINETTVYGALESICRFLKTNYKESKILFIIGHKLSFANGALYENQDNYWNVIRTVCEKWGIPYIDIGKTGGLACYTSDWLTLYFGESETMGTHPNYNGYLKFYVPQIESKMKAI